ncbi:MAG: VanZ family protein [Actinobacteria bacterium]|nr:VanZ family protein [Actinomycetota bacterium]
MAAVAWAAAIVVFGVLPTQGTVHAVSRGWDDLATVAGHFAAYALLAFVLAVALDDWRLSRRALLGAAALAVGLGAAIELVQAPLPYRDCQLGDALVDAAGAALGLAVLSVAVRARARRSRWRRG